MQQDTDKKTWQKTRCACACMITQDKIIIILKLQPYIHELDNSMI